MKDKMIKKKSVNLSLFFLLIIGLVIIIVGALFVYLTLNEKDFRDFSDFLTGEKNNEQFENTLTEPNGETGETQIGTSNTDSSNDEKRNLTEKELIYYMGIYLKLNQLHKIPFTSITPKIQIYLEEHPYFIEIIKEEIIVKDGVTSEPDIIIRTTYEEILKMEGNEEYAKESILLEKTGIEVVANEIVLASKGYLTLYKELEEAFTGYSIRKI